MAAKWSTPATKTHEQPPPAGGGRYRVQAVAYLLLLRLYPGAFRAQYRDQMLRHFHDLLRYRYPGNGLRVWSVVLPDLFVTSVVERKEAVVANAKAWKVIAPLVVIALGLSFVTGGANVTAMLTVFGIALAGMAVLAGIALAVSRKVNRPAEDVPLSGFARHWWTVPAVLVALSYLVMVGRDFILQRTPGSAISLAIAVVFASLTVGGLVMRSRKKVPLGNWLAIFGSAPGLAAFWVVPTLVLSVLAIVGSLAEIIAGRTLSRMA